MSEIDPFSPVPGYSHTQLPRRADADKGPSLPPSLSLLSVVVRVWYEGRGRPTSARAAARSSAPPPAARRPARARLFGQLPVNLILFSATAVAQVVFVFRNGQTDGETREERERERERESARHRPS